MILTFTFFINYPCLPFSLGTRSSFSSSWLTELQTLRDKSSSFTESATYSCPGLCWRVNKTYGNYDHIRVSKACTYCSKKKDFNLGEERRGEERRGETSGGGALHPAPHLCPCFAYLSITFTGVCLSYLRGVSLFCSLYMNSSAKSIVEKFSTMVPS